MGNFYTNFTLKGPSQKAVAAVLGGRNAFVSAEDNGCVVVFDEESDKQDMEVMANLAARLSGELNCPVLAVLNHDDDILWYQLYLNSALEDEYDSTPGYFEGTSEDQAPAGGNAQKLCAAFGVKTVSKVEKILRNQRNRYVFAVERHSDLATALKIPFSAVGTGFDHIISGELPDEMDKDGLVNTKDLPVPKLGTWPKKPKAEKVIPGYYKLSYVVGSGSDQVRKTSPAGWMPPKWKDLECAEQELSEGFLNTTANLRKEFRQLSFAEIGFKKAERLLNPSIRDNGSIAYLHNNHSYFGHLIYRKIYIKSVCNERESLGISFTAVFKDELLTCTNTDEKILGTLPKQTVVVVNSNEVGEVYRGFLEQVNKRSEQPRVFPDTQAVIDWIDAHGQESFEERVRRGVFIRMSDYDVELAQREMPRKRPKA